MPMLCLAGTYRVLATEPDGDSIRFYADDAEQWKLVPGQHAVQTNAGGGAQLRLDGIDALETHYTARGSAPLHQPLELAHKAADELLRWLGFRGVQRDGERVTSATPQELPGFLLTRGADLYGRCVALIGRGDPPGASGTQVNVNLGLLRRTANHRLVATGLAYPTFYLKLFRRLVDYLALNDDDPSLAGFKAYLAQRPDQVFILSTGHYTGFDYVVDVKGQVVQLTTAPEDLVFQEL